MPFSDFDLEAFLTCSTKGYLRSVGSDATEPEFAEHHKHIVNSLARQARIAVAKNFATDACPLNVSFVDAFRYSNATVLVDCGIATHSIKTTLHGVERVTTKNRFSQYIPIRRILSQQIRTIDRILLAFDALAIESQTSRMPTFGRIVFGWDADQCRKVKLTDGNVDSARTALEDLLGFRSGHPPPELVLNRHCSECGFQTRCRNLATENDDLSLISAISEKERIKLREKGIFTVNQLSHTFSLRRNRKNPDSIYRKRYHSLTALAIRERKTHVLGQPVLKLGKSPVFLDVESSPSQDFFYLIGICYQNGNSLDYTPFWADDPSQESVIWNNFVATLRAMQFSTVVHYGSYEKVFLEKLNERHSRSEDDKQFVTDLAKNSCNVLSTIYSHVYFPVYSNGLKAIGGHCGYAWNVPNASGARSVLWRAEWEEKNDDQWKQQLIDYNADDCRALALVTKTVSQFCFDQSSEEVVSVSNPSDIEMHGHSKKDFSVEVFKSINAAAYWDHQRDMVYVKSSRRLKTIGKRQRLASRRMEPNRIVDPDSPKTCLQCGGTTFSKKQLGTRTVYDLKFTNRGITRDVVRNVAREFHCKTCGKIVEIYPPSWSNRKYGRGFVAFSIYHMVHLCILQRAIARTINELFSFNVSEKAVRHIKTVAAEFYNNTYEQIKTRIVAGKLVHADETLIKLRDGSEGYVWVLANMEEVYFFFTRTRESEQVKGLLEGFSGVLVSDFYPGYESIPCPQQKCLIHLMRDLNDDLLKQPFNSELRILASKFGAMLQSIVETIDEAGLKSKALKTHQVDVTTFYDWLEEVEYSNGVFQHFKERFEKSRSKLFTFLDHDDIPWNNNNAEHAIKAFAKLRNAIEKLNGERSIAEYLVLLSVSVTCEFQGVPVLTFLRSGLDDIDEYIKRRR
ncbi:TM0106 family RecB-like putative nuclease [Novipirellula sp. SH528]|uniref:TM0106 family RecB-like putative nuclease n=1 Tax=Novipirellula sp. SH528 TaxID=3454466 RepID=UPI003F9FA03E